MLKKILISLIVAALLASMALGVFARKAPGLFLGELKKACGRELSVDFIEYRFPSTFELRGLRAKDTGRFSDTDSLSVEYAKFEISWLSLTRKQLLIYRADLDGAKIFVRRYQGRVTHVLSGLFLKTPANPPAVSSNSPGAHFSCELREIRFENSRIQFLDYDAKKDGFATDFEIIHARLRRLIFPADEGRLFFKIRGNLMQGRDQKPASISMEGWSQPLTQAGDIQMELERAYLPYFEPYTAKFVETRFENGYLSGKLRLEIKNRLADFSADLEAANIFLAEMPPGSEIFGLNASEIAKFLRERTGRFRFYVLSKWDLDDRSKPAHEALRKSLERSLKSVIFGQVDTVLDKAFATVDDSGPGNRPGRVEETVKKIKDFLKY